MKLSKNSINARVYSFVYGNSLPTNLCPYFWKSLLALLLLPLVSVFQLLYYPLSSITWVKENFGHDAREKRVAGLLVLFMSFILFMVGVFISASVFTYYQGTFLYFIFSLGGGLLGAVAIIIIAITCAGLVEKTKKTSLIKEYFKAKKGKYCPQIEWTEK